MQKLTKCIFWMAGLALFVGLVQAALLSYQAYVTDYFIRSVKPEGQDLERFEQARSHQIDLAENGIFVVILQSGIIIACWRLRRRHVDNSYQSDAANAG